MQNREGFLSRPLIQALLASIALGLAGCGGGGAGNTAPQLDSSATDSPSSSTTPPSPPATPTPPPDTITPITSGSAARDLGGPSPGNLPSSGTVSVTLTSDPTEYVGDGQSYSYSDQNSTIRVRSGSNWLAITIDGTDAWAGWIQLPTGDAQFQPGTYTGLWQVPGPSARGSLDWSMDDRFCTSGDGSLTVNSVTYVAGVMTGIDFNFDQYCVDFDTVALHGHVVWNVAGSTVSIAPLSPPPSGLWEPASGATPPTGNYIYLESDPGDFVGQGESYTEVPANSLLTVSTVADGVQIQSQGLDDWLGQFQTLLGQTQLQPGYYGQVGRWHVDNPARGGLSWSGDLRGCNRSMGWFVVDDVSYTDGAISALDLRFEQHCELWEAALRGEIHWRSSDTTEAPGPSAIPAGLWQPAPGATPASGNYVYLDSDAGDYIVSGSVGPATQDLYTSPADAISVSTTSGPVPGPDLTVMVNSPNGWTGQFAGMYSLTQLQPGYYGPLMTTYDPATGSVNWFGMGRACDYTTGWLAVDSVSYTGSTLTGIDLRFEQHCNGDSPALHGKIHWSSP